MLRNKKIVYKLFNDVAPRYADRNGGYTRIIKLGPAPRRRHASRRTSSWSDGRRTDGARAGGRRPPALRRPVGRGAGRP